MKHEMMGWHYMASAGPQKVHLAPDR